MVDIMEKLYSKPGLYISIFCVFMSTLLAISVQTTAIAFLLRFHLISVAGPIFLSYVAYLIPIFAILWGFIFLKETININSLIGIVLVLFGVFVGNNKSMKIN